MAASMAYVRRKPGSPYWYLVAPDHTGKMRERTLGTRDYLAAQAHLERWRQGHPDAVGAKTTARAAVEGFLAAVATADRAPATLTCYRHYLGLLTRSLGPEPHRWTRRALEGSIRKGWSPRTKQLYLSVARAFRRWAVDVGYDVPDVTRGVRSPRIRALDPDPIPDEKVADLLAYADDHDYLGPPVALALLAGLSLGDVRSLTWAEVRLAEGEIRRRRKKTDQRLVLPIASRLRHVLEALPHRVGRVCRGLPKSDSSLRKTLQQLLATAGITPPRQGSASWHRLRHTFATRLVAAGADLPTVARLLGHRPGSTVTLRYVHGSPERDREAVERAWG